MKFRTFKYPFALMLVSFSFLQTTDAQTPVAEISKLSQEVAVLLKQGARGLQAFLKSHANTLNINSSDAVIPDISRNQLRPLSKPLPEAERGLIPVIFVYKFKVTKSFLEMSNVNREFKMYTK